MKEQQLDSLIELKEKQIFEQQAFNKIHFTDENIQDYDYFENHIFSKCPIILLNDGNLKYYSWDKHNYVLFKNTQEIYNLLYSIFRFSGSNIKSLNEIISKGLKTHALTFYKNNIKELNENEIMFLDCVFNIDTLEVKPTSPEIYASNQIPINFRDVVHLNEDQLQTPNFDKYLYDWLHVPNDPEKTNETITCIKEMIGFLFKKDYTLSKAFILVGNGSNGKSTLINLIQQMIGKGNYTTFQLEELVHNKDYCKAELFEKLVNLGSEISDKEITNPSYFKALTGDTISAREIYKKTFEFKNYCKQIFSANKIPIVKDASDGFHRRWVIVDFPHSFESASKNISETQILNDCKPEFARFIFKCLLAFKNVIKNRKFSGELSVQDKKKLYNSLSNPILTYIEENIEVLEEGTFSYTNDKDNENNVIYKTDLDSEVNKYLKSVNKLDLYDKKGYAKYLLNFIDSSRKLCDKNHKKTNADGKEYITTVIYFAGVRFKHKPNPTKEIKIYDVKSNKFKEIKEFRDVEYGVEYNWSQVCSIFNSYSEDELRQVIKDWKKQGAVTEVRSGTYRFENKTQKEVV